MNQSLRIEPSFGLGVAQLHLSRSERSLPRLTGTPDNTAAAAAATTTKSSDMSLQGF